MNSKSSKTNHKVFIAGRDNVQFWYPEDRKVATQKSGSIKFEDSDEDCVLEFC